MQRHERLVSLMASLMHAPDLVPFEEIRRWFPDDYATANPDAGARKFERDKADLLELGVPLEYVPPDEDGAGGYRVDRRRYALRPVDLSPEEAAVALLAGSSLLAQEAFPYQDELRVALSKLLLQGSPPDSGRGAIALHPAMGGGSDQRRRIEALSVALANRKRLSFTYRARYSGETSRRKVDPYGMYCHLGRWAFVGYSHERQATRAFLVERMSALRVNSTRPRSPDFEVPVDFDVRAHAMVPPWRYEAHDPVTVEIAMDPEYAWLAERWFGATGRLDGAAVLVGLEATNTDAVVEWVLSMGPHARVASPVALAKRVRGELRAILARYGAEP